MSCGILCKSFHNTELRNIFLLKYYVSRDIFQNAGEKYVLSNLYPIIRKLKLFKRKGIRRNLNLAEKTINL